MMSQLKQSAEQLKSKINNLKVPLLSPLPTPLLPQVWFFVCSLCSLQLQPELSATDLNTLEEEDKTILSEKNGEMEYLQSLLSNLEKLKVHTCQHALPALHLFLFWFFDKMQFSFHLCYVW